MPSAALTLPGHASSVPAARRFVETVLDRWGRPEIGWPAALCVSELAGNCALHARTDFTVAVVLEEQVVRVEVTDGSPRRPKQRSYDADATTGRGLRLVEQYATRWGCDPRPTGKTVWVELAASDTGLQDDREPDDASVEALLAAFDDDPGTTDHPHGDERLAA
ncbi:MAG: ATP-binding protein [Frankiales bacterium]|nr:MAG: ATP-binding protein [Frankiales bacterium]